MNKEKEEKSSLINSSLQEHNNSNNQIPQITDTSTNIFITKEVEPIEVLGEKSKLVPSLDKKSSLNKKPSYKKTKTFEEDENKNSSSNLRIAENPKQGDKSEEEGKNNFIQEEDVDLEYDEEDDNVMNEIDQKEKRNRQLFRREKICDTDTEGSDSEDESQTKWIILPDNKFKRIWDMIILITILYSAIVTPYKLAFVESTSEDATEITIDCIIMFDIILSFFTAYTDEEENLVKNRKKIVINYLKSWFTVDLISVIPFTLLVKRDSSGIVKLTKISSFSKLHKIIKLAKLLRMTRMKKRGNVTSFAKFFLDKLKLNANIEKLVYFLLTFILLSHLSTCIWYFVAKLEDLNPNSWVVRLGYIDSSKYQIYILSFYWTLTTVTTVGYGDVSAGTTPERIYNLFIMSFGVLMYSFAIGSLSSIVSSMDEKRHEMNKKLKILASIKKEYNLEQELYDKVRKIIKFDLSRNQRDKMQFLQDLPHKLRIELSQIMHDKAIQKLDFFTEQKSNKPSDFFAYVAPMLKPVKFCQNDYLYKIHDLIEESNINILIFSIFCFKGNY